MARVHVSAERTIPAPAKAVYDLLADYHEGHLSILPPAFSDFTVLEGRTPLQALREGDRDAVLRLVRACQGDG